MAGSDFVTLSATLLGGLFMYKLWKAQAMPRILLPPGPTSFPLIGHLFSMPTTLEHLEFLDLGKRLGASMYSLSTFGTTIIVLNDAQDAINLFDKRSGIYSDRTNPPMINEPSLLDWAKFGSIVPYGDRWRKYRRLINPWLHKKAAMGFRQSQLNNARSFMQRLLGNYQKYNISSDLQHEVYRTIAATLLLSVYGYLLMSLEDPFLVDARLAAKHGEVAFMSSNFLVNVIPALIYVPAWFPGAGWKKTAHEWRIQKERAIGALYQWATRQLHRVDKSDDESMVAGMLKQAPNLDLNKDQVDDYVREVAFTLLSGGTDTMVSVLMGFFLAMILFPEAKAKAQKEIDVVVGIERLPNMEDIPRLPYLNRIIQETKRWFPVVPLGLPHTCYEDDNYKGYDIPKGTIIIGNIWAMSRDPNVYKNPEAFDPDRFLDPSVPASPVFGWGRRRCPGQHFADASLFAMIASFLATFDIGMAQDESGQDIIPSVEVSNTAIIHPAPFRLKLTPRSARHEELIRADA